jgi:adenine-specific DNA-methyltransferase
MGTDMTIDDYYIEHLMATNEKLDFVRVNETDTVQYYVPPQAGKLLSDNWLDILLSGSYAGFDTEKNVLILDRITDWITKDGDIILDSFAGSGTTAHSVLNTNHKDGGHRKFILVEMEDYAEATTAERVRRVITGYGEGKKAVEGTGGGFSFYELGAPLMIDGNLNPDVPEARIREYVYYTETKLPMPPVSEAEPHLLGVHNRAAYYFYYLPDAVTTLNEAFLRTIKTDADSYMIYADINALDEATMKRHHMTFKKIPRDITLL